MTGLPDVPALDAWSLVGWTMLHFLWAGAILGGLAALGRVGIRSAGAGVQYLYALGCLLVLTLTPLVLAATLVVRPGWLLPPAQAPPPPALAAAIGNPPGDPASAPAPPAGLDLAQPDRPATIVVAAPDQDDEAAPSLLTRDQVWWVLGWVAPRLPYAWLVGAPLTFGLLMLGLAGAERLRRDSRPVLDPALLALRQRLADSIGVARQVALATCDRLVSPVLIGIVRPAILLPAAALTGWTPDQLEMALLHELIHVRRRDNLVLLLQRVVESVLFFHPVVWIVSGWVHREREHATDAEVVRRTGHALAYAETLLALATVPSLRRPILASMAEGDLVSRIRRLLEAEDRGVKLARPTLAAVAASVAIPAAWLGTLALQPPAPEVAVVAPKRPLNTMVGGWTMQRDEARLKLAREAFADLERPDDQVDVAALTRAALAQATLGDEENARKILQRASRLATERVAQGLVADPVRTLFQIARAQGQVEDRAGAKATLHATIAAIPSDTPAPQRLAILTRLTREFALLNDLQAAREIAQDGERLADAEPDRLADRAALRVAVHDVDGAFALLGEPPADPEGKEAEAQAQALAAMARGAAGLDPGDAWSLLDRAQARLEMVPNARAHPAALAEVAAGFARIGEYERALRAARLLDSPSRAPRAERVASRIHALCQIAQFQSGSGHGEAARRTLASALDTVRREPLPPEQAGSLVELSRALLDRGDREGARFCLILVPPGRRHEALTLLALAEARAGDATAAAETARHALADIAVARDQPPPAEPDDPFLAPAGSAPAVAWTDRIDARIARMHAALGDFDQARQAAVAIPNAAVRVAAIADVARAQAAAGDARSALDWARAQRDLPPGAPDPVAAVIEGLAQQPSTPLPAAPILPIAPTAAPSPAPMPASAPVAAATDTAPVRRDAAVTPPPDRTAPRGPRTRILTP